MKLAEPSSSDRKIHVLMVTNYFAPEGGAAAVRLTRLARQLQRRGHRVTVLTSLPHYPEGRVYDGYRHRLCVSTDLDGVLIVQTWVLATTSRRISRRLVSQISFMLSAIPRGLTLPRPDVVLIEGQPLFTGMAGVVLAILKRRPYVFNVSDLWPDHLLSMGVLNAHHPIYRVARRIVDAMYSHAASIVAMSPRWAEIIASHLKHSVSTTTICNGVDLSTFRPGLDATRFLAQHGLDREDYICSFIGTFSTPYDFELMIKVILQLHHHDRVQFVFIGQGTQEDMLKQRLAGLNSKVKWIPRLASEDIPLAWNASYLTYFALHARPLYRGTIPAKLYEAMACGVPVVAAMEGLGADLIESSAAGITVPCGDAVAFGRALEGLLANHRLRQQCSTAGRHYAEAHFDAEEVAAAYEETLLASTASPTGGASVRERPDS